MQRETETKNPGGKKWGNTNSEQTVSLVGLNRRPQYYKADLYVVTFKYLASLCVCNTHQA